MRWIAMLVMMCLPAAAQAEELCGRGDAASGSLKMTVIIAKPYTNPNSPYVSVDAVNLGQPYTLSVHYSPTEGGLGRPSRIDVRAVIPLVATVEPKDHQIEWRSGSGPWFNPRSWSTPRRYPDEGWAKGHTDYAMAQSGPFPLRTELLDALSKGHRFEFRSLDPASGVVVGGYVDYPAPPPIEAMYRSAQARAVAGLKPCGPPIIVRPAPNPGPIPSSACDVMRQEGRAIALHQPRRGPHAVEVERIVDCEGRTMTRVFTVTNKKVRLAKSAQETADRSACLIRRNRILYEQDRWSFRAEFKGPDGRVATATARAICSAR